MPTRRHSVSSSVKAAPVEKAEVGLEALCRQTGVAVETLRAFAAVSDPKNKSFFSPEAARKAFSGVKVRKVQF